MNPPPPKKSVVTIKKPGPHLTGQAQVFEETSQRLVQVGQLGHAVLTIAVLLVVLQRVKVLGGHGAFVLAHKLPVGEQLGEMTPENQI